MTVEYDPAVNALYVTVSDRPVAATREISDCMLMDVDASGAPVGVEIIGPCRA
ncbi:DUF2283 domain-containing protein [Nonomuraea wenchangensis]|uniref:DUF2283 domain-containing protein n=1 Tax=Nonomuraea wenchangensis TaxID=568860 RepID=UPI003332CDF4